MKILLVDTEEAYLLLQMKISKAINKTDFFDDISKQIAIEEFNYYNLNENECIVAVLNDDDSFKYIIHRIVNKNEFPKNLFYA